MGNRNSICPDWETIKDYLGDALDETSMAYMKDFCDRMQILDMIADALEDAGIKADAAPTMVDVDKECIGNNYLNFMIDSESTKVVVTYTVDMELGTKDFLLADPECFGKIVNFVSNFQNGN